MRRAPALLALFGAYTVILLAGCFAQDDDDGCSGQLDRYYGADCSDCSVKVCNLGLTCHRNSDESRCRCPAGNEPESCHRKKVGGSDVKVADTGVDYLKLTIHPPNSTGVLTTHLMVKAAGPSERADDPFVSEGSPIALPFAGRNTTTVAVSDLEPGTAYTISLHFNDTLALESNETFSLDFGQPYTLPAQPRHLRPQCYDNGTLRVQWQQEGQVADISCSLLTTADGVINLGPVSNCSMSSCWCLWHGLAPDQRNKLQTIFVEVSNGADDKNTTSYPLENPCVSGSTKPRNVSHTYDSKGRLEEVRWLQDRLEDTPNCSLILITADEPLPPVDANCSSEVCSCQWSAPLPPIDGLKKVMITVGQVTEWYHFKRDLIDHVFVVPADLSFNVTVTEKKGINVTVTEKKGINVAIGFYVINDADGACFVFTTSHASCPQPKEAEDCTRGHLLPASSTTTTTPTATTSASTTVMPTDSATTRTAGGSEETSTTSSGVRQNASLPDTSATSQRPDTSVTTAATIKSSTQPRTSSTEFSPGEIPPRRRRRDSRHKGLKSAPTVVFNIGVASLSNYSLTLTPWYCDNNASIAGKAEDLSLQVTAERKTITVGWESVQPPDNVTYTVYVTDNVEVINASSKFCPTKGQRRTVLCNAIYPQRWCQGKVATGFWEYNVTVEASSQGKNIKSQSFPVETDPDVPGKVTDVQIRTWNGWQSCEENKDHKRRVVCVTWKDVCPRDRHTFIDRYKYELSGSNEWGEIPSWFDRGDDKAYRRNGTLNEYSIVLLKATPGKTYKLTIRAISKEGKGQPEVKPFSTPYVHPPFLSTDEVAKLVPKENIGASSSTISFVLTSTQFYFKDNGFRLLAHGLIVTAGSAKPRQYSNGAGYNNYPSYSEVKEKKGHGQRRKRTLGKTAPKDVGYRVLDEALDAQKDSNVKVIIGNDHNCSGNTLHTQSNTAQGKQFCDGQLDPDTSYSIWVFRCNEANCTTTVLVKDRRTEAMDKTEEESSWAIVVALSIVSVVLLVIIVIILCCYTSDRTATLHVATEVDPLELPQTREKNRRPMKLAVLESVIAKKQRDDCLLLRDELTEIRKNAETWPHEIGNMDKNRCKNRYGDVVCYDHSRVKLSVDHDNNDYINANYIPGYSGDEEYVATQGPLPYTVNDFWRMVWEHSMPIIVMLTLPVEKGRIKCEQYWPTEEGQEQEYDDVVVKNKSKTKVNDYTITVFSLKNTLEEGEEQEVVHFHYLSWPDMTADLSPEAMLDFVSTVRRHVRPENPGPMVVHCSAGVGRTGTFISVDYAMQFLKERPLTDSLDFYSLVLRLREFRCLMIQTEEQYIFLHQCARLIMSLRRKKENDLGNGQLNGRPSSRSNSSNSSIDSAKGDSHLTLANDDVAVEMEMVVLKKGPGSCADQDEDDPKTVETETGDQDEGDPKTVETETGDGSSAGVDDAQENEETTFGGDDPKTFSSTAHLLGL